MEKRLLFGKARDLFTGALSIGVFGLNSFFLLMWKNQGNSSLVYVIFCITLAYIIALVSNYLTNRHRAQTMKAVTTKMRLIFRWVYVAVYLTIILFNMRQMGNGSIDFSNAKLVFQWVMFLFIALTIPRDILVRKAIAWAKLKWKERKEVQYVVSNS